jgi:hypothetical protein
MAGLKQLESCRVSFRQLKNINKILVINSGNNLTSKERDKYIRLTLETIMIIIGIYII